MTKPLIDTDLSDDGYKADKQLRKFQSDKKFKSVAIKSNAS